MISIQVRFDGHSTAYHMFQCHSDVTHPCYTHNNLLPLLLGNTLPFFDDLCKRSARFIPECIQSDSLLARSIARFGIVAGFVNSFNVRNVVFLCSCFGWQFSEFVQGGELVSVMRGFCYTSMIRLPIVIGVQLSHYWIS